MKQQGLLPKVNVLGQELKGPKGTARHSQERRQITEELADLLDSHHLTATQRHQLIIPTGDVSHESCLPYYSSLRASNSPDLGWAGEQGRPCLCTIRVFYTSFSSLFCPDQV